MSDLMITRFKSVRPTAVRTGKRHLGSALRKMLRAYLTRRALIDLTPAQRTDIGVSASAAVAEAARLPWDVNPGPARRQAGIVGAIRRALERARSRRLVSQMSAWELRDIGLSPSEAQNEATKYFWLL